MYGEESLKDRQSRNWFDKFRPGNFLIKDEQRSSQPNKIDNDQIKAIIESVRHVTVREIEEILKIPKLTIDHHIQRLFTITSFENDDGPSVINHHKQHRS